jgi:superfamily II DNA or RNA helicase
MIHFKDTFTYKIIYIFGIPDIHHNGILKIGEATVNTNKNYALIEDNSSELVNAAKERIDSYTKTAGISYEVLYTTIAVDNKGNLFRDYAVHEVLSRSNIKKANLHGATEWFKTDLATAKKAINAVKEGKSSLDNKDITKGKTPIIFRPEQRDAIRETIAKFTKNGVLKDTNEQFLWNAKMRFGKTLTALQVIRELKFKKTIIITHRPVVKHSWFEDFGKIFFDVENHIDFGSKTLGKTLNDLEKFVTDNTKQYIYFASIQDLRGSKLVNGKFDKNTELFDIDWDFIIIDEAHEGTQTDRGDDVVTLLQSKGKSTKTLFLSGTPFNLLSGLGKQKFDKSEIYTWDYVMEQQAKYDWALKHFGDSNPYETLPKLNIFTYNLEDNFKNKAYIDIEDKAFKFTEFFRTWTGNPEIDKAKPGQTINIGNFVHENDVKAFLDLLATEGKHNYPFSNVEYRNNFRHTLWMVPGVKEAKALSKMLKDHKIFGSGGFKIVNVAGDGDEEEKYDDALKKVEEAITENPQNTRTITISCGKLTTGVTVPAWTAVLMLSGSSSTSASSYLQTIFRVQSPADIGGKMKTDCFVFDFAPDRTLKMIAEAGQLSVKKGAVNDSKKLMGDFLNFCPVIGISGSNMNAYNTENMLVQLKRAMIDRVARNGFDDRNLYNDNLLKLDEIEIKKFQDLKKILKASNSNKNDGNIVVNEQGLDTEIHEVNEDELEKKKPKDLTDEEKQKLAERKKMLKERSAAISILRGIAIRIPLMVYGADLSLDEDIGVHNFTTIVDDKSWVEFMPKDVTKEMFNDFSKYFDNEVFVEAGKKIRLQAKAADELQVLERVEAISNLFSTFKNPDKETVLTPWKVVNMHLGSCIGGYVFYDDDYENLIKIDENTTARRLENKLVFDEVYSKKSKILDINSKTGLYPLFTAFSIYQTIRDKGYRKNTQDLWKDVLRENIYVICRTKMASLITKRTLKGFMSDSEFKTNVIVYEDFIDDMKKHYSNDYEAVVKYILNNKTWNIKDGEEMKFNAVVGNPPYQSDAKQQIYTDFYLTARKLGDVVSLIFPVGWQEPKSANNLAKLNTIEIKQDKQIVFIDNRQNVFPGISGAEWTNFILWKKGYDNGLDGAQLVYTNGIDPVERELLINKSDIEKPNEINELAKIVQSSKGFISIQKITSVRKPYGLSTDVLKEYKKYGLPPIQDSKIKDDDYELWTGGRGGRVIKYVPKDYPFPSVGKALNKYKVFVPYAWGNWSMGAGLGGAYSDIIIAGPGVATTETWLESGCFDSFELAYKHAKYLMTRFLRGLLYVNKFSQHSTTAWGSIPIQDYSEEWWNQSIDVIDSKLMEKYSVNFAVKEFVFKNIQKKSEKNIIK